MSDIPGNLREKESVWKPAKQAVINIVRDAGKKGISVQHVVATVATEYRFDREDSPKNLIRVLEKEGKLHYEVDNIGQELLVYGPQLGRIVLRSEKKGDEMSVKEESIEYIRKRLAEGPIRSGELVREMNQKYKYANDTRPYEFLKTLEKNGEIAYDKPIGPRDRKVFLKDKNPFVTKMLAKDYSEVPTLSEKPEVVVAKSRTEVKEEKTRLDEALEKTGFGQSKPEVKESVSSAKPEVKVEVKPAEPLPTIEKEAEGTPWLEPPVDEEQAALVELTKLTVKGVLDAFDKEVEKHINAKLKAKMTLATTMAAALGAPNVKGAMSQRDALRKFLEAK